MSEYGKFQLPFDHEVKDLAGSAQIAAELAAYLSSRTAPLILLFSGEMGAGKTTFVRLLVQALSPAQEAGIDVASPTYALHHRYNLKGKGSPRHLDHWDLYRMKDESELDGAGFWEILEYELDLMVVEWPSMVSDGHWPRDKEIWSVQIDKKGGESRHISIKLFRSN